jgi:hypothetical protein
MKNLREKNRLKNLPKKLYYFFCIFIGLTIFIFLLATILSIVYSLRPEIDVFTTELWKLLPGLTQFILGFYAANILITEYKNTTHEIELQELLERITKNIRKDSNEFLPIIDNILKNKHFGNDTDEYNDYVFSFHYYLARFRFLSNSLITQNSDSTKTIANAQIIYRMDKVIKCLVFLENKIEDMDIATFTPIDEYANHLEAIHNNLTELSKEISTMPTIENQAKKIFLRKS